MIIPLPQPVNTPFVGVQATHAKLLSWTINEETHQGSIELALYANDACEGQALHRVSVQVNLWLSEDAKNTHRPQKTLELVELEDKEERTDEEEARRAVLTTEYDEYVTQWEKGNIALTPTIGQAYGTIMQGLLQPMILSSFGE